MADETDATERAAPREQNASRDSFQDTLLLMAIFGGRSGTENMLVYEWSWDEGDTSESLARQADELADEIAAQLDECAERAPATERVAVQLVSMRGALKLGHQQIDGTLGEWPDARLREALRDLAPRSYAPLVLVKVLTEETLRGHAGLYLDDESQWATPASATSAWLCRTAGTVTVIADAGVTAGADVVGSLSRRFTARSDSTLERWNEKTKRRVRPNDWLAVLGRRRGRLSGHPVCAGTRAGI